jgi:CheY-like chemotaxis protein
VLAEAELQGNPAAHPGRFVATSVSDTGTGMSREVVARAFEPFFTTKAPGAGSGLGLSHVYGLVSQLGGIATLRSELGVGTTVTLYLPVALDAPPPPQEAVRTGGLAQVATRVLVVDDKPEIRQLAGTILRRAGYEVETAPGGAEALMLFESRERFDLIVSDVVMQGGLDGVALVRKLRADHPGLAALLVTGYAPDAAALEASGVPILAKPFTRQAMLSAVEGALSGAAQLSPAGPGRA